MNHRIHRVEGGPPADASCLAAALRRCEGYCELQMWSDAWQELEALPEALKEDLCVLVWRMQILVGLNEHEKASHIGLSLVEKFPDRLGILLMTAEFLMATGRFDAAKALIEKALIQFSGRPDLWLCRARVEFFLGNPGAAKKCLSRYIALYPDGMIVLMHAPELQSLWNS